MSNKQQPPTPMPPVPADDSPDGSTSAASPPETDTSATPARRPRARASEPEFAFVLNTTRGPRTLLVPKRDRNGKRMPGAIAHDMKILGPGMNYVATSVLTEAAHQVEQFAGQLEICDPTKIAEHYAIDYAKHTASRQAAKRWLEVEQRPKVRAALTQRLAKRAAPAEVGIE